MDASLFPCTVAVGIDTQTHCCKHLRSVDVGATLVWIGPRVTSPRVHCMHCVPVDQAALAVAPVTPAK